MQKTVVVVAGPTGVGKTTAAIEIAKHFNTSVISADSRQIFREMRIGTAVPKPSQLEAADHYFIGTHSIHDPYNASRFETEALELIDKLFKEKDILVLAGGSMLYIDAILKGIDLMPDADPQIREHLKHQHETEGLEGLRIQLKKLDPDYYAQVDLKNPSRIIHALEITIATGRPYSSFRSNPQKQRSFDTIKLGLNCDRAELHRLINKRVDEMISEGLEDEARKLYTLKHLNALNTVGYKELFDYFEGLTTREKAIELIKRNSRRYARKQLTWFRRDPDIKWFDCHKRTEMILYIQNQLVDEKQ